MKSGPLGFFVGFRSGRKPPSNEGFFVGDEVGHGHTCPSWRWRDTKFTSMVVGWKVGMYVPSEVGAAVGADVAGI